jgi:hypothetical protein
VKIILPAAVAATVLLEVFNLKTSEGAGLLYAIVFGLIVVGVGAYEAWSKKRGVLGWTTNILASAFGCFLAVGALGFGMEAAISRFQSAIVPQILNYVVAAVGTSFVVFGSWLPIKIIDLFRPH